MKVRLDQVNYIYSPGTVQEHKALQDVSLEIGENEFTALVGSTGSGKSTLAQILNGLKTPTSGTIAYDGQVIGNDKKELHRIRCRIGLVFQYPEYQLFDETVIKDVSFGPRNKGLSEEEALEKAGQALRQVGLREDTWQKSPFDLSGGEKRRAAIAGILAMEPEILILDEPTAGLDPAGKTIILDLMKAYHEERHGTVIMVSHNMDEVAEYAQRIIVMDHGVVWADDDPHEVFRRGAELASIGLAVPQVTHFCSSMGIEGPVTMEEAVRAICDAQLASRC